MSNKAGAPVLSVSDLVVEYTQRRSSALRANDDLSFTVGERETLGVVGESGSGKSTVGRAILGLVPVSSGQIQVAGRDVTRLTQRKRRELSSDLQVVFQDPYSSLNPTRTVGQSMGEVLIPHGVDRQKARARAAEMLKLVGLPADAIDRYPNRFSGGQRQRIAIARALMASPRLVVCDEAVSALDLSVQAQVLNLLTKLQRDLGISYLFISHDLSVVRHVSHRILVLYKGRIMEHGSARAVSERPVHPYTRLLLAAEPVPDPARRHHAVVDAPIVPFAGVTPEADACPFASRCPHATDVCVQSRPALETTHEGVAVACHHWRELNRPAADNSDVTAAGDQHTLTVPN